MACRSALTIDPGTVHDKIMASYTFDATVVSNASLSSSLNFSALKNADYVCHHTPVTIDDRHST